MKKIIRIIAALAFMALAAYANANTPIYGDIGRAFGQILLLSLLWFVVDRSISKI